MRRSIPIHDASSVVCVTVLGKRTRASCAQRLNWSKFRLWYGGTVEVTLYSMASKSLMGRVPVVLCLPVTCHRDLWCGNKQPCCGRRTARRACQYRKKACNRSMTLTYSQGHHSCSYLIAVHHITSCLWTIISTSLSRTVFKTLPLLKWTWQPVTLRTPSFLTTKLKLQATYAF